MLRGTVHRSVLSGVVGAWLIGLGCQGPPHPLAYRMQGGEDSGGAGGSEEESVPLPVCHDGTTTGCASIVSLAAGGRHSCAAASDGVVRCWGANDSYQLGDPTGPPSRRGKRVLSGLRDPDEMVLGWRHGCAMSGSSAHCWGRNHMGQLGTSDKVFTARPARVRDEVARIATFGRTTCSLAIDDDVHCWGLSLTGQGWIDEDHGVSSSVPALVDGLDDVDTIAVGHYHACAASRDGTVWCWGEGTNGALGQGEAVSSALPVEVVGLPPPLRLISAGDRSTCAYAGAPAALYCWGWLAGDASTPSLVEGLPSGTVRQLELG
ncbi:MAG: hypothetical protein KC731_42155, partial [Myxococcales bacterium]|nr:hypothetical protein [Myxococcales bacterium]